MASVLFPGSTHYCHQCNTSVRVVDDVLCPYCQSGFVEEISADEQDDPMADFIQVLNQASARVGAGDDDEEDEALPTTNNSVSMDSAIGNPPPAPAAAASPYMNYPRVLPPYGGRQSMFHIMSAMMQHVQPNLQAANAGGGGVGGGGTGATGNLEIFFDNGAAARRPGHFGDYFFGTEFDQLLHQLAENDTNRYGTPPASKTAVDEMPTLKITQEHLASDSASCAVCKEDFELGVEVRQMPCKHMYHPECILPWLSQHNSCPVCRFELATDDADYNQIRTTTGGGGTAAQRRFSFFPWLLGANTEASGSGGRSEAEEYDSLQDVD